MTKLTFVTGNSRKLAQAQKAIAGFDIALVNQKVETPEIQSEDSEEIARFSAKYAAEQLGIPVVTTDASFCFVTLNNFPGPFIKFINKWLTSEDLLKLMEGKTDRTILSPVCIAYCEPGKDPVSFVAMNRGEMATIASGEGSAIDQVYIPEGYSVTIACLEEEERLELWSNSAWIQLAEYLTK